jgi:hypothetical protein
MQTPTVRFLSFLLAINFLWACASSDQKPASSAGPAGTGIQALSTQQTNPDTVDWLSAGLPGRAPAARHTDPEPAGQRLGLIGPIIATGGLGSQRYIAVYDPAGVLVGTLTYKQFRKEPARLEAIIAKAHQRGEIQNYHALQYLQFKRFAAAKAAARK